MTVTVEKFHGGPVSVEVLQQRFEGERYLREIVLRTTTETTKVVLYGIVDLNLAVLDPQVRSEILEGKTPLGHAESDTGTPLSGHPWPTFASADGRMPRQSTVRSFG
jgi:hypothetical protein